MNILFGDRSFWSCYLEEVVKYDSTHPIKDFINWHSITSNRQRNQLAIDHSILLEILERCNPDLKSYILKKYDNALIVKRRISEDVNLLKWVNMDAHNFETLLTASNNIQFESIHPETNFNITPLGKKPISKVIDHHELYAKDFTSWQHLFKPFRHKASLVQVLDRYLLENNAANIFGILSALITNESHIVEIITCAESEYTFYNLSKIVANLRRKASSLSSKITLYIVDDPQDWDKKDSHIRHLFTDTYYITSDKGFGLQKGNKFENSKITIRSRYMSPNYKRDLDDFNTFKARIIKEDLGSVYEL